MNRSITIGCFLFLLASPVWSQGQQQQGRPAEAAARAPIAGNPVVEITGVVTRIEHSSPGLGSRSLLVDVNGSPTNVILGSMRYLMEQNFNPKAGEQVKVKGYKLPSGIMAIEVKLGPEGKTIKLRDESGWPVWRRRGGRT